MSKQKFDPLVTGLSSYFTEYWNRTTWKMRFTKWTLIWTRWKRWFSFDLWIFWETEMFAHESFVIGVLTYNESTSIRKSHTTMVWQSKVTWWKAPKLTECFLISVQNRSRGATVIWGLYPHKVQFLYFNAYFSINFIPCNCYRREVDATYILELHKDEKKGKPKPQLSWISATKLWRWVWKKNCTIKIFHVQIWFPKTSIYQ